MFPDGDDLEDDMDFVYGDIVDFVGTFNGGNVSQNTSNSQWGWYVVLVVGLLVIGPCTGDTRESRQATYNRSLYSQPYNYLELPTYIGTDPYVAENASYYGEVSDYTGRPKTVYVRGYFRKDGTYIRSHYRSSPR